MTKSITSQKNKHNMEVNLCNSQADLGLRREEHHHMRPSKLAQALCAHRPHSQAGLQSVAWDAYFSDDGSSSNIRVVSPILPIIGTVVLLFVPSLSPN